jgi:hypothetical protein
MQFALEQRPVVRPSPALALYVKLPQHLVQRIVPRAVSAGR